MNRKVIITFILSVILLLAACETASLDEEENPEPIVEEVIEEVELVEELEVQEEAPQVPEYQGCQVNADCPAGELCIETQCRSVDSLYSQDCEQTCNFATAQILTSDGETYSIGKSQGSYSYAGAIEWKLLSTPPYCSSEDFVVPILISKKNAGKVLSEEVITVPIGVESKLITHPTISRVQFRVEVESVDEVCG